ncbi:CPBP family intramembrane metalloprotease [Dactylosporangium vinaceum]|uniref:CPBP family intramembrane glutamic endopeptidase n=1 Tax=Dactylosporangium vinaceum TaxID=53362 RepID=UPI001CA84206|nr:CPBP family intramembrane glutamic endopeptidase [Dactylosporangium vinaceum]UAB93195.1 CPBP family intramembrane metalloprotease [Dactylosporangium vinaceum]
MKHLRDLARAAFVDPVPRNHEQTSAAVRRRRVVVVVTLAVGAVLLGWSLTIRPGDPLFYLTTVAVAATWLAGSLLSGPLHLGRILYRDRLRRPILTPIATGLLVGGVFVLGALVVQHIPPLRAYAGEVLDHARYGAIVPITATTLLNGLAEEVFFRGALFAAIGRTHPVLISTIVYALATVATANPMLVFAAAVLGAVLGLQRRASGGILAPILTHVTWSTVMLFALPPLLGS